MSRGDRGTGQPEYRLAAGWRRPQAGTDARALERGQRPRRSVLFAAWNSEERGLLGAWAFVEQPLFPLERIAGVLNMDMIGRNEEIQVGGGIGLELKARYDNNASNLLRRSDHWPFLQRGVPALWFHTGLHPDYHTPYDRPEKINYDKMEKITRLVYQASWDLAQQDGRPRIASGTARP